MLILLLVSCGSSGQTTLGPVDSPEAAAVPIDAPQQSNADWTVDCEGGADFTTISDAIDAASDNEWIEVAPCTYEETVDFGGKSLWISSSQGPATTIIDAGKSYAVVADRGEGDGAALVGFTIQNGGGSYGTIYVVLSALRLEDVTIRDSRGGYYLIYGASADLELVDVTVEDSSASYYTMYMSRGAFIIDGLTLECSGNSYAFLAGHGSFFMDHSNLTCKSGYAIYNENSVGRVQRSTLKGALYATTDDDHYSDTNLFENTVVSGNLVQTYGTLILRNSLFETGRINVTDVYNLTLQANVFQKTSCAFTNTWTGDDTAVTPSTTVEYNDFYGLTNDGCDGTVYVGSDGNIDEDPLFNDPTAGDYSTPSSSPLVDAGLEDAAYDDPDGSRNDIGLYGGPRSVGGGW